MEPTGWGRAVAAVGRRVRPADRPTDGELLGRYARDRDEAAFAALVDRHAGLVWGVAARRAADRHAAEDAAQATFLALARRAGRLSGDACVAGWLHAVAARAAARTRRRPPPPALAADPPDPAPDPLAVLSAREVLTVIDDEIARLPARYRLPLLLCGLGGLTRDEAAARLGWPAGSVKGRLERGRELLRRRLHRRGVAAGVGLLAGGQAVPAGLAAGVLAALRGPAPRVAALAAGAGGTAKWPVALAAAAVLAAGLGVGLSARQPAAAPPPAAPPAPAAAKPAAPPAGPRGTVTDADGSPVAGATVLAVGDMGQGERKTTTTGTDGRFAFDALPAGKTSFPGVLVLAVKDGFAPGKVYTSPGEPKELMVKLPAAGSYSGVVRDPAGRPVAGATVEAGFVSRSKGGASWGYHPPGAIRGTPAERFYFAAGDADGRFRLTGVPAGGELLLRVSAPGFAELDTGAGGPKAGAHVAAPDAKPAELVLQPEAVIRGRVTSRVAGVPPSAANVQIEGYQKDQRTSLHGFRRTLKPNADGRFVADRLPAGPLTLSVNLPPGTPATAAGTAVTTVAGKAEDVTLELVPGVEVAGAVRVQGSGGPVAGVAMATEGLVNPHGFHFPPGKTGADGRFAVRLPPGKVSLFVWTTPPGYGRAEGRRREVDVPAGVARLDLPEPYEVVKVLLGLDGRVVDSAGKVVPHVKVSALQHTSVCGHFETDPVTASGDGRFHLPYSPDGPLQPGTSVPLRVVTDAGKVFEANAVVPHQGGLAEVRLPTAGGLDGPQDVKPDELAGLVVDAAGKPLPGVKVHLWDWVDDPENYTFTGPDGVFRKPGLDPNRAVQVRYKKDGYSPVLVVRQPVGVKGLVVGMDRATYFEGVVRGPDGKPAAGAVVRADQGPKNADGVMISQVWTETVADAQGRYKLMVAPDGYEFHVKAPGVGVARLPKTAIAYGQKRTFDIALRPGVTFRVKVIDSMTGRPAAGLRLYDWQQKAVDGTSAADGTLTIPELLPGEFRFSVRSDRYARWWSDQSPHKHERKSVDDTATGWQRNFDDLTFDLTPGMGPVTVVAEPAVRVTGRVLDPGGRPVGGATVAPALTGTGNSLTGSTRFSVETKPDGTFAMTLPAGGAAEYNLVAHDGKYGEWRKWANGVLPPVRTAPGQAIEGVTLTLTRPAVVRGRVVDKDGNPVAGREVRAHAADKRENRYYDPTVTTAADGTFELRFVRPAGQHVQVYPFWMDAEQAPPGTSKLLTLKPGEVVEGVSLVAAPERAN